MKFEVIQGIHTNSEGVKFAKGDVVDSKRNLAQIFKGKFKRRADYELLEKNGVKVAARAKDRADLNPDAEDEGEDETKSTKTTLPGARPAAVPSKPAEKPAAPATSLAAELNADDGDDSAEDSENADEDSEDESDPDLETDDDSAGITENALGKNVTKKFPEAVKAELLVFEGKDKKFSIADPDQPEKGLGKPVAKAAVAATIKKLTSK